MFNKNCVTTVVYHKANMAAQYFLGIPSIMRTNALREPTGIPRLESSYSRLWFTDISTGKEMALQNFTNQSLDLKDGNSYIITYSGIKLLNIVDAL